MSRHQTQRKNPGTHQVPKGSLVSSTLGTWKPRRLLCACGGHRKGHLHVHVWGTARSWLQSVCVTAVRVAEPSEYGTASCHAAVPMVSGGLWDGKNWERNVLLVTAVPWNKGRSCKCRDPWKQKSTLKADPHEPGQSLGQPQIIHWSCVKTIP